MTADIPKKPTGKPGLRPKALKQDDSIMGTNNSSIVSKRSVERLYYPHEPHFFRYFVKKPQRRAPLINRGYWLRMRAIDHVAKEFLFQSSTRKKVVINLGAGYDPLPWQCLTRYPDACKDVTFIDIDYKDLMLKKRQTVLAMPELSSMFSNVSSSETDILLRSDQYLQIGCDLRETSKLSTILSSIFDLENSLVLFTAEVSVTYMTTEGADALLKWAGSLSHARFCILEQLLPQGSHHPFAKTMMAHFNKLQTPLQSVQKYPTTQHQEERFRNAGWTQAIARNLWDLWSDSNFLSNAERRAVDEVEPFDEWEEFALFGCHYVLLVAGNGDSGQHSVLRSSEKSQPCNGYEDQEPILDLNYSVSDTECVKPSQNRRFAATLPMIHPNSSEKLIGNFGGFGQSRLHTTDLYGQEELSQIPAIQEHGPAARMCHTITDIGGGLSMLVGGRNSPSDAMTDCWIHEKARGRWERVDDFPKPIFRHSTVCFGLGEVVVMGGKSNSTTVLEEVYCWSRARGWRLCSVTGNIPGTFGSTIFPTSLASRRGLWSGGIDDNGVVCSKSWSWEIFNAGDAPSITIQEAPIESFSGLEARFGASVVTRQGSTLVVGGVIGKKLMDEDVDIICLTSKPDADLLLKKAKIIYKPSQRPLLIGTSVAISQDDIVLIGGGAVCFSFGTFWTPGILTLSLDSKLENRPAWRYLDTVGSTSQPTPSTRSAALPQPGATHETVSIPRSTIKESIDFERIIAAGQPVVLENSDIGLCKDLWTNEYLKDKIGADREVVIHQATSHQMDFVQKNFTYGKRPFGDFLNAIDRGERLYLRSLSSGRPSEDPANIAVDFPSIAGDFRLPPELAIVSENAHSSPLRISGPVNMWLHYDVMANILCQVRGTKHLLLFPPSDIINLGFKAGSSSSSLDVLTLHAQDPKQLGPAIPHSVHMSPGDILFIPPLWLHSVAPTGPSSSISVNVFFRNLRKGYAAGRDVYGNRDLQAYEKGRMDIAKIARAFAGVPRDMKHFYLSRLAEELKSLASEGGSG